MLDVNFGAHFKLQDIPRPRPENREGHLWVEALALDRQDQLTINTEIYPPEGVAKPEADDGAVSESELRMVVNELSNWTKRVVKAKTKVAPKSPYIASYILRLHTFHRLCLVNENALTHFVLTWNCDDFVFRELAFAIVSLAAGNFTYGDKHVLGSDETIKDDASKHPLCCCEELAKGKSTALRRFLSDCHAPGKKAGSAPEGAMYWFEGVLVYLCHANAMSKPTEVLVARMKAFAKESLHRTTFQAITISLLSVMLFDIKEAKDQTTFIECTDELPLIPIDPRQLTCIDPRKRPPKRKDWDSQEKTWISLEVKSNGARLYKNPPGDIIQASEARFPGFIALTNFFEAAFSRSPGSAPADIMLPKPTFSFTIPSVYDDTLLEGRVYHPSQKAIHASAHYRSSSRKRGAIVAHPYAPLGGSFDDPVVDSVGHEVLEAGFVLGTFNFRGAGGSKGRTSWTAKPELADYISFIGFFVYYLDDLEMGALHKHDSFKSSSATSLTPIVSPMPLSPKSDGGPIGAMDDRMVLVLGGYSYGSLITVNLPPLEQILNPFHNPEPGVAAAEIRLRATHLSEQANREARQAQRGRSEKRIHDGGLLDASHAFMMGGEESEPGTRRRSRETRRSMDVVRKSFDRSRVKLGLRSESHDTDDDVLQTPGSQTEFGIGELSPPPKPPEPRAYYLLISPLLPPVSSLATMFTVPKIPKFLRASNRLSSLSNQADKEALAVEISDKLTKNPSLVVYGTKDFFTSHRKLEHWTRRLALQSNSLFQYHEIVGAGHFWHEFGVERQMRGFVQQFLRD
ncbi:hypothetical protein MMC25_008317 [Agyrium rufum]|nr:hypothetical protein [Agyrium rufum]